MDSGHSFQFSYSHQIACYLSTRGKAAIKKRLHCFALLVMIIRMNSQHRKTLAAIYSQPAPANLEWRRIEDLFLALGSVMVEGGGSRVAFVLNNRRADFHRPHPGKEAKRYQVRAAREFLEIAGVKP